MASAKTCTFTSGSTSITVRSPLYPEGESRRPAQIVGRAWGGAFYVADMQAAATPQRELSLQFVDLTAAEWADVLGFIRDTVAFSSTAFEYTDPWDVDHTNMRYVSGLDTAKATKGPRWSVTLLLAKDMGV